MSDNVLMCRVCNRPIIEHRLVQYNGVAHTQSPAGNYMCSRVDGERLTFVGEINTLRTIVRSLRWRAGRMRPGGEWTPDDLDEYSNHWQKRIDRYLRIIEEYYW